MLKELTEYGNKIKKIQVEMRVTLSKIKKNLQGTNSGGEEAGIQINDLKHKEEISIQPEQREKKKEFWDISKCADIQIIRMPEGEEEEQEVENLFENNNER